MIDPLWVESMTGQLEDLSNEKLIEGLTALAMDLRANGDDRLSSIATLMVLEAIRRLEKSK